MKYLPEIRRSANNIWFFLVAELDKRNMLNLFALLALLSAAATLGINVPSKFGSGSLLSVSEKQQVHATDAYIGACHQFSAFQDNNAKCTQRDAECTDACEQPGVPLLYFSQYNHHPLTRSYVLFRRVSKTNKEIYAAFQKTISLLSLVKMLTADETT